MPPSCTLPFLLASASLISLTLFYLVARDVADDLSPQGCRMSWMSPSYLSQTDFNTSWSPLANRYSLWLYREVGWESNQLQGTPVLFIPGNAGSSRQVRSIASSAARQFYTSPHVVAPEFSGRVTKPLDFFAVEFNEDLSAFHGPTVDSEISYTSQAISYILSLYPLNTSIIIMGHSMGGIVATSLLPSSNISAIITMSTPHILPPARFDSRIENIYVRNKKILDTDPTPILSLCGGATDAMIPSESCILPTDVHNVHFRRTVFTSALEGAWTGVGHREMVWCHQVRWRLARAALELAAQSSRDGRSHALDKWLRDAHTLPPGIAQTPGSETRFTLTDRTSYKYMPEAQHLVLARPRDSFTYLIPLKTGGETKAPSKAVVLVGMGSIGSVGPHVPLPLHVSVYLCSAPPNEEEPTCDTLEPTSLKLIPYPIPGKSFPVPSEGADESEGVAVFEADIPPGQVVEKRWLGIRVDSGDGRGWVLAGLTPAKEMIESRSTLSLFFRSMDVFWIDKTALRSHFIFPNLFQSALIVYKYAPIRTDDKTSCSDPLLTPVISHTSHAVETHYFLAGLQAGRALLHSHTYAPYVSLSQSAPHRPLELIIYSSGAIGCDMIGFSISIDWPSTLGRWGSRFPTTLVSWTVGVVAAILFTAWGVAERGAAMPSVSESLSHYVRHTFQKLLLASFVAALLPITRDYYLGMGGDIYFAPIAPLLIFVASGLVCVSWWALVFLMWPIGALSSMLFGRFSVHQNTGVRRSTIVSMAMIFTLIFLFVPWQVAYLGSWLIHVFNCATSAQQISSIEPLPGSVSAAIPLIRIADVDSKSQESERTEEHSHGIRSASPTKIKVHNQNHNMHILLLMTWLLPFVAPVLVVWARTLVTAGLTTPFDGDHNFLNVAPFLILVDFTSWRTDVLFEPQKFERVISVRWMFVVLACAAFFVGPRKAYCVFDVAKVAVGLIVIFRVGRRYWDGK